jgi:hypothetical protein
MSVQHHIHLLQISMAYAVSMSSTSFKARYWQSGYEIATRYTYILDSCRRQRTKLGLFTPVGTKQKSGSTPVTTIAIT